MFLDSDLCTNIGSLKTTLFFKELFKIAFILVPVFLIIRGMYLLYKELLKPDKENVTTIIRNMVVGVMIFFIPVITNYVISLFSSNNEYLMCYEKVSYKYIEGLEKKELLAKEKEAKKRKDAEKEAEKEIKKDLEGKKSHIGTITTDPKKDPYTGGGSSGGSYSGSSGSSSGGSSSGLTGGKTSWGGKIWPGFAPPKGGCDSSEPKDEKFNKCFVRSHNLVMSVGPQNTVINLKVGETKSVGITLPSDCGTLVEWTRRTADGAGGWSSYVSQDRSNITNTGFTWLITGKKKGSTTISQTVQYNSKAPSGNCVGNVKSMVRLKVKVS